MKKTNDAKMSEVMARALLLFVETPGLNGDQNVGK